MATKKGAKRKPAGNTPSNASERQSGAAMNKVYGKKGQVRGSGSGGGGKSKRI